MISVGSLDTPVEVEQCRFTQNANYGGIQDEVWSQATTSRFIWAHIVYRGGKEGEEAEQKVGQQKVDFYMRYDETVDKIEPGWRIAVEKDNRDLKYFYIESVAEVDGRHKINKVTAIAKDNN